MRKLRNPDDYPTRYEVEPYGPGWQVVEYSKFGRAVRGEYLIEKQARKRVEQLIDMSRNRGGWIPKFIPPG